MPTTDQLNDILHAAFAHQWMAFSVLFIGLVLRVFKSDDQIIPWVIPEKYRTWLALGLGAVLGALKAVVAGSPLMEAIGQGLLVGASEVVAYHALVKHLSPSGELWTFKPAFGSDKRSFMPVALLFCGFLGLGGTSCAALNPVLASVAIVAGQGSELLALIEMAERAFFAEHPDAKTQAAIEQGIHDCHLGIASAQELAYGTRDLNEGDADAAFKQFRDAYGSLYALLVKVGLTNSDGRMKATIGTPAFSIPKPLAFAVRR